MNRVLWSFCVYLEAVSVLPQLTLMQKTKVINLFTWVDLMIYHIIINFVTIFLLFIYLSSTDYWTFHCILCLCFGSCKILELCTLDSTGLTIGKQVFFMHLQIYIYMLTIEIWIFGEGIWYKRTHSISIR